MTNGNNMATKLIRKKGKFIKFKFEDELRELYEKIYDKKIQYTFGGFYREVMYIFTGKL